MKNPDARLQKKEKGLNPKISPQGHRNKAFGRLSHPQLLIDRWPSGLYINSDHVGIINWV